MELISFNTLIEIFNAYKNVIIWFGSISLFVFLFSLLSIKWLVALIPEDYFVIKRVSKIKSQNPLIWYFILILKNLVGYSLILGGVIMLVLPGQGLFTIIIGLMLSNYPGKYIIEKKFIAIPTILKSINCLTRARLPITLSASLI